MSRLKPKYWLFGAFLLGSFFLNDLILVQSKDFDELTVAQKEVYGGTVTLYDWLDQTLCTGWCVQTNPLRIVGAAHCVLDSRGELQYPNAWYAHHPFWGERYLKLNVIAYDASKDLVIFGSVLSLIDFNQYPITALRIVDDARQLSLREELFTVVNSPRIDAANAVLEGVYDGRQYFSEINQELDFITVEVFGGCSGAPVCTADGKVIGVLQWSGHRPYSIIEDDGTVHIEYRPIGAFAIAKDLRRFVQLAGISL